MLPSQRHGEAGGGDMSELAGYRIGQEIYRSNNSIICRATQLGEDLPVVIKMLPEEFPPPKRMSRFRREFEMTRKLQCEGLIGVHELKRHGNGLAMVVEDFGGDSLTILRERRVIDLQEKLAVAVRVAQALAGVHEQRVMHKDVNPSNIVWNAETGDVRIIDFGISTELSRESQVARNPSVIEGTLAYMSPEQTGRMNRAMDYRTDLYSLGVTLYELFTGRLPFEATDPLELVHCHIARVPPPAARVARDLPPVLSRIVARLMEKSADDRYQTAAAVATDLRSCLEDIQATGAVSEFEIAQGDVSDRFQIPQRLYGREVETAALLEAFDRVATGGKEMMLVAGYSGIGKSALVHEVHKPIVERRGYFASGKFDQLARNIPYASMIQAFKGLVQQLLTETQEELEVWREKIVAALGVNGGVITEVIGELELIIGEQPPVAALGPVEARNRFNMAFAAFTRVFAGREHPLTLFLDDLQWADLPSLQLVRQFMTDSETTHMLLVGAYRDNEVDAEHPLMESLEDMRRNGAVLERITLDAMAPADVDRLVAETLKREPGEVAELGRRCMEKTRGNPFFLNQFLIALYQRGAIDFDAGAGRWTWDLDRVEAMEITDNVGDLMAHKIVSLPAEVQHVLKLAACIGNRFDLKTLSVVNERSPVETNAQLWEALSEGLVIPLDDSYKFLRVEQDVGQPGEAMHERTSYSFLHDRVQQAAYSLIAESDRKQLHQRIGDLMIANLDEADRAERLFAIAGHLNIASDLLQSSAQRDQLAQLNLEAGLKGIATAAYEPAADYLLKGIELVGAGGWQRCYQLTHGLHEEAVVALNQCARFDRMEEVAAALLANAREVLDRVKTYQGKILACVAQTKFGEAVDNALEILQLLGEDFPEDPQPADVESGLAESLAAIDGRGPQELLELPPCEDPIKAAAIRILANIASPAYVGRPSLFPLIVFRQVVLSCRYGNTGVSGYGYVTYAIFVAGELHDPDTATALGELGNQLVEKYDARDFAMRTAYIPHCFLWIWKRHAREAVEGHSGIYQLGLETGDLEFGAWCLMMRLHQTFFIGADLDAGQAEAARSVSICRQVRQQPQMQYSQVTRQAMLNLMGRSGDPLRLVGEAFDEDALLPRFIEAKEYFGICNFHICKLILAYLFGDLPGALHHVEAVRPYAAGMTGLLHVPVYRFYGALAQLARYRLADEEERSGLLAKVEETLALFEHWARHCPENFLHKWRIIQGERAAVLGETVMARAYFNEALRAAGEYDYTQEEALAYELVGRLWLGEGEPEIAGFFLAKARHRYEVWGAWAKARDLSETYRGILPRQEAGTLVADSPGVSKRTTTAATTTTTGDQESESLDLRTVLKASQAISREIVLERMLEQMMRIVIENAGAELGVLLMHSGDEMVVTAKVHVSREDVLVGAAARADAEIGHSAGIVNYVARTGENVLLSDPTRLGAFTRDEHVERTRPRSILSIPISYQGDVNAVLYLENNLTSGAFTEQRLLVLDLLLGQIAISVEHARLYANLEERVEQRTRELAEAQALAEQASDAKSEFLATMSHELRTPLSAIIGYSQMLIEFAESMGHQVLVPDLEKIDLAGKHLLGLINSVLDLSKVEAGRMSLEYRAFDCGALAEEVRALIMPLAQSGRNELSVAVAPGLGEVVADTTKVRQCLFNLLSNACKFTQDGEVTLTVEPTRAGGQDRVLFTVRDTGIGMTEEVQARIFEPFTQADSSTQRRFGGTGLGLTISQRFCVLMGGRIEVESRVGHGTTFTMWIPARPEGEGAGAR